MIMSRKEWLLCPICGRKTREQICEETVLIHFPLYCPKCKKETYIDVKNYKISIHKSGAQTQN